MDSEPENICGSTHSTRSGLEPLLGVEELAEYLEVRHDDPRPWAPFVSGLDFRSVLREYSIA